MTAPAAANAEVWGRRRLLGILVAAGVVALALLSGLVYAVYLAIAAASSEGIHRSGEARAPVSMHSTTARGHQHRDAIAAAPMLQVPAAAARPAAPATEPAAQIEVPTGTRVGPAAVLTGFPHTPQGAVGQLGAIETSVLQAMSLPQAQAVYHAWTLPGGVGANDWGLTHAVQAFLASTDMGPAKDPAVTVVVQPAAGLVKGTDGPDWTLACVLVEVSAVVQQQARIAYGHCERMQWSEGRWMIAPGTAPARAPSTWPGSPPALRAGWRSWISPQTAAAAGDAHHERGLR